jgi:tetratricopeptide (TPR) repeat protein
MELGYARLRNRELEAAAAAAARARPTLPAQAHELEARIALARGRLAEAREKADAAVAVRNPQPVSWLIGAEVRIAQGDLTGALERIAEADRRAKRLGLERVFNLEALRADALARSGRPREAEAAYRLEAAAFPGNLVAQANLAALLFAQRRRADALAVIDAMVAANPNPRARQVAVATLAAVGERAMAARYRD